MTKGQRIYLLRTQKKLTMEELGKRIGVGKATIKKYENGLIENIPSDKIEALADALDSTPQYIMGWEEDAADTDALTQEILERFSRLTPENQARMDDYLRLLLSSQEDGKDSQQ